MMASALFWGLDLSRASVARRELDFAGRGRLWPLEQPHFKAGVSQASLK